MSPSTVVPFPVGPVLTPAVSWRKGIVAASAAMQQLLDLVEKVARSTVSVILEGETGTGKEVIARAIHEASGRTGALVACNCAAIPKELAEAEIFGHARGAFTGATDIRKGLFEEAHNGTLLLDEIGELELPLQAKLLRVLEEGVVRRVGSHASFPVCVRVVAATHSDLALAVETGRFRLDLFHRLAGIELHVPPLRDRPEDVAPLVERFMEEAIREHSHAATAPVLASGVLADLACRPWPGNIRELRQAVRRAVALGGEVLTVADFPIRSARPASRELAPSQRWADVERQTLASALERHGSIRRAAKALGLPKSTVADRVRALGLVPRQGATSD